MYPTIYLNMYVGQTPWTFPHTWFPFFIFIVFTLLVKTHPLILETFVSTLLFDMFLFENLFTYD